MKAVRTITNDEPACSGIKWAQPQQWIGENGYPGMELDRVAEYPGVPRQRTCGASSFGADEWMGSGTPGDGPQGWPEWKQEDEQAYQHYPDEVFTGDDVRPF